MAYFITFVSFRPRLTGFSLLFLLGGRTLHFYECFSLPLTEVQETA